VSAGEPAAGGATPGSGAGGDPGPDPRVRMRRQDRAKDETWIQEYLHAATWGFLALVGDDGRPYVHSNLFAFDEERHCLWMHGYREGRMRSSVDACAQVVFSAAGMGRLLPGATALSFSLEYASVVVYGTARVVEDAEEATHGLRMLMEKYAPHLRYGEDYQGIPAEELERTAVYRVDIEAWSGKQKEAAADFPGAYTLPEPGVPFPAGTRHTHGVRE